uniref:Uncharacterized protein n=1 Tax=viral metagenome TaxID=1070528 RepID=A0A6C0CB48_9ZZZZ
MDIPDELQVIQPVQIGDSITDHICDSVDTFDLQVIQSTQIVESITDHVCDSVDAFDLQTLTRRNVSLNIQDTESSSEEYDPKKPPQIKMDKRKVD